MKAFRKVDFIPLIGQPFTLMKPDGNRLSLHLETIESHQAMDDYESFTLCFKGVENEPPLPDDSYLIENEAMGEDRIFLSATKAPGPDPYAYYYESVFNVYMKDG